MPFIPFDKVGAVGVISGVPPHELPRNAWSGGQNVRMLNGSVHKFLGHTAVFGTPSVAPYWLLPVQRQTAYYWIYAGLTKAYVWDGSVHTNITRQTTGIDVDYTATSLDSWTGGVLGGIPVLNNGYDDPQMWNPVSLAQRLQALSAWPANTKARVIRPYLNYLVAYDVTKVATRYQRLVKWSHPADPGAVPASWDHTDPTKDAGEVELSETQDFLVDALPLRSVNVVYKEETTWAMQYVGPPFIFRFSKMFGEFGALATGCMCEIEGKHVVVTKGDIVIHDGQQARSIFPNAVGRKMAASVFESIDNDNYAKAKLIPYVSQYEVWFIYPSIGMSFCDKALVWNYRENTFAQRDLPNVSSVTSGIVDSGAAQNWDADTNTWDSDSTTWDQRTYNPVRASLLMAGSVDTRLYKVDEGTTNNGSAMFSYIERTGLTLDDKPRSNVPRYLITEVFPRMRASGAVDIYVGGQATLNEAITWQGPFSFNPATQKSIKCYVSTAVPAIKVQSNNDVSWELDGYYVAATEVGLY